MSKEEVTIKTVVGAGLAGTATIDATGEVGDFINPGAISPLVPDVTKNLALIQRVPVGLPPVPKVVIILS